MSDWRHNLSLSRVRSAWKGACRCGWQSRKYSDLAKVTYEYKAHTKLIEREGKKPSEGA